MSYDTRTYDFACEILDSCGHTADKDPKNSVAMSLAQTIQDRIEDFLSDLESDRVQELEAARDEADDRRGKERDEWKHEAAEWQRLK